MRKNYSHDVYTFTVLTLNHNKINDIYTHKKIPKEQKSEIKTMLLELGLDRNFEKNLFYKMRYDNYTFYNEVINALRISIELTSKSLNNAFLAPMQSGKTGTIKFLCNTILPNINFLNPNESVLFLTSMTDVDLRDQNIEVVPGVISLYDQHAMNIFLTFKRKDEPYEVTLKYGTPLMGIFPMTEKDIEIEMHHTDRTSWEDICDIFPPTFLGRYHARKKTAKD